MSNSNTGNKAYDLAKDAHACVITREPYLPKNAADAYQRAAISAGIGIGVNATGSVLSKRGLGKRAAKQYPPYATVRAIEMVLGVIIFLFLGLWSLLDYVILVYFLNYLIRFLMRAGIAPIKEKLAQEIYNDTKTNIQSESWSSTRTELLKRMMECRKETRKGLEKGQSYLQEQRILDFLAYYGPEKTWLLHSAKLEALYVEATQVNTWVNNRSNRENFVNVCNSLHCLRHPLFELDTGDTVTPATLVSGQELAIAMGLPQKSVPGVQVIETVPFGRNVRDPYGDAVGYGNRLKLDSIYHMWEEESTEVWLDKQSLAAHTFVTGSTGAGKSNTVYHLLNELTSDPSVHFMVVEPAKGEYKDAFGGRSDVSVYGTNPKKSTLLRLNPFAFPVEEISVQEHLDRLVEIFNACWPMYAAMPAILKDACERAYVAVGWDMVQSVNNIDSHLFPSFSDVLDQIRLVVAESDYSADNKGDYTGALVTRIRSLTTGIFGQVFTNDPRDVLTGAKLFDENVIIDLSRVGSSETKALIMGFLVMQLLEYRMANHTESDSILRHVTVLEEAHNLLKRTSTEQSSESSNLAGKSVEMLGNAIAEMRTYGEGFIIADQAPGLMDMAVIRNTNTKIIMRLPDESDRELVGKAAGLSDLQIKELAKLPMGVAAVYQNNWLEPILCKVIHFDDKKPYIYHPDTIASADIPLKTYFSYVLGDSPDAPTAEETEILQKWLNSRSHSNYTQALFERGLHQPLGNVDTGVLCYNLFNGRGLCMKIADVDVDGSSPNITAYITSQCAVSEQLASRLCNLMLDAALEFTSLQAPGLLDNVSCLRAKGWL